MKVLAVSLIIIMLLLLPFFVNGITSDDKKKANIVSLLYIVGFVLVSFIAFSAFR